MPTDLSNGYKKPNSGENGTIFCPVLEDDWERVSTHDHDGSNSEQISTKNLSKGSATAVSGSWAADGSLYKQTVALPSGYSYDTTSIEIRDNSNGDICYPKIEKVDASNLRIWTNDDSLQYNLIFA